MNEHPTLSELEHLIDGWLDPGQESSIRLHVDNCELCRGILESVTARRPDANAETQTWSYGEPGSSEDDREFERALLGNRPHRFDEPPRTVFPGQPTNAAPLGSVDHYDVLRLLGQGTFGEVYLAWDRRLERKVAVKVLRPRFSRSEHFRQQLQNEAKRIARVRSDHVVEVYDVRCQEEETLHFLVMEYVEGCSLSTYLENRDATLPPPSVKEVVQWILQATLGVQAIHQRGYSHNDLKQANLLVELPEGGPSSPKGIRRIKIADFGLLQSLSIEERKFASDTAGGTEVYMSPQRLESTRDTDIRDDIYSLGVILYHLLTGQFPRVSTSTLQFQSRARSLARGSERVDCLRKFRQGLIQDLRNQPLKPASSSNASVNAELDSMIACCLAVERQDRYRSTSELADDLLAWSEGRPVLAHGRSFLYTLRKWCSRHPIMAITVMVVVLTGAIYQILSERSLQLLRSEARQVLADVAQKIGSRQHSDAMVSLNNLIGRLENNPRMSHELQQAKRLATSLELPIQAEQASGRFTTSVHLSNTALTPPIDSDSVPRALTALDDALTAFDVLQNPKWAASPKFLSLPESEQKRLRTDISHALLQFTEIQHRGCIRSLRTMGLPCILEKNDLKKTTRILRVLSDSALVGDQPLLREGDLIIRVNNQPAWNPDSLSVLEALYGGNIPQPVSLLVFRAGREQSVLLDPAGITGSRQVPLDIGWRCVVRHVPAESPLINSGVSAGDLLIAVNQQRLDSEIPTTTVEHIEDPLGGCLVSLLKVRGNTVSLSFLNPRSAIIHTIQVPWTTSTRATAERSGILVLAHRIRQEYAAYIKAIRTPEQHREYHIDDASLPIREIVIHSFCRKMATSRPLVEAAFDIVQSEMETTPGLASAFQLVAEEKYTEAKELLRIHLQQDPLDPDALQLKILCCTQRQQTAEAIEACTSAILLMPQMPAYRRFRAELYVQTGELELAGRDADALYQLFPGDLELQQLRQRISESSSKPHAVPP